MLTKESHDRPAGPELPGPWSPAGTPRQALFVGLPGSLSVSAERLLVGASVYREPADRNALVFQVGEHDWTAARAAQRPGAEPPYRAPAALAEMVAAGIAAGALTAVPDGRRADSAEIPAIIVDRRIARELHRILASENRQNEVTAAHLLAAKYWQWRAGEWPQSRTDIHDLLEARYHLLEAAEIARACQLTEVLCAQLHAWADLDRETELLSDMLAWLPQSSPSCAALIHRLSRIAQMRRDYAEAERLCQQALHRYTGNGDRRGVARCHHDLGVLAQARGEYVKAERCYQQAADAAGESDAAEEIEAVAEIEVAGSPETAPWLPMKAASPEPVATASASPVVMATGIPATAPAVSRPVATHRRPGPRWQVPGLATVAVALLALAAAQLSGALSSGALSSRVPSSGAPSSGRSVQPASAGRPAAAGAAAGAVRRRAAAWIARQVSRSAIVSCDPAMCASLAAQGIAEGNLLVLGPAAADPLGSDVVVATAAVRGAFGPRLTSVYAPVTLASFGTGSTRIEVRVVAPDGSAAYLRALAADVLARREGGSQLLHNRDISVPAIAGRQLSAGEVDSRLLSILVMLAGQQPVRVLSFGGNAAGASAGMPQCSAEIAEPAGGTGGEGAELAFLRAQRPPYLAAISTIRLATGQTALSIRFASPSPLGLLGSPIPAQPIS